MPNIPSGTPDEELLKPLPDDPFAENVLILPDELLKFEGSLEWKAIAYHRAARMPEGSLQKLPQSAMSFPASFFYVNSFLKIMSSRFSLSLQVLSSLRPLTLYHLFVQGSGSVLYEHLSDSWNKMILSFMMTEPCLEEELPDYLNHAIPKMTFPKDLKKESGNEDLITDLLRLKGEMPGLFQDDIWTRIAEHPNFKRRMDSVLEFVFFALEQLREARLLMPVNIDEGLRNEEDVPAFYSHRFFIPTLPCRDTDLMDFFLALQQSEEFSQAMITTRESSQEIVMIDGKERLADGIWVTVDLSRSGPVSEDSFYDCLIAVADEVTNNTDSRIILSSIFTRSNIPKKLTD
jgi:hypothetical protein